VKAAVRWLRGHGGDIGVLPDAIGAWGESAGAHLAVFVGLGSSDEALNGSIGVTGVPANVQAVVAWYPPTRFLTMDAEARAGSLQSHDSPDSPESRLIGGPIQEHAEAAAYASPITHVRGGAAPMLLLHGLADRTVPHQQSVALADALQQVGADVTLELVPGAGHVFEGVDVTPLVKKSADYLADRLGDRQS
jgi:acetyl esterase/lipase